MIAKILSSAAGFRAVEYNTDKISKDKGELMLTKNFGYLEPLSNLGPQDYINYLEGISSVNSKVKAPQFHATLSCKGSEYDKSQLTDLAVEWMNEMGYGKQPYLVIFHNDTGNNHVHIVSTRVDQNKYTKINDSFEKLKAVNVINKLINDVGHTLDVQEAKEYNFSTEAQFKFLLEKKGYTFRDTENAFELIKFGKVLDSISKEEIKKLAKEKEVDLKRRNQIKAIISKYKNILDANLIPEYKKIAGDRSGELTGYSSQLSKHLKEKFGVELVFHFSSTKQPYGYTVFDHANKNVYKGGEVLPLSELIASQRQAGLVWIEDALHQLILDKGSLKDFDNLLTKQNLSRTDDQIFDDRRNRIFQLEKEDFNDLLNNEVSAAAFVVFNEVDKLRLSELYSLSPDKIQVNSLQSMYKDLLNAVVYNYPTIEQGLNELNFTLIPFKGQIYLMDNTNNTFIDIQHISNTKTQNILFGEFSFQMDGTSDIIQDNGMENTLAELKDGSPVIAADQETKSFDGGFNFFIADDVDDEAIHGRNRKRKKHARGNSR